MHKLQAIEEYTYRSRHTGKTNVDHNYVCSCGQRFEEGGSYGYALARKHIGERGWITAKRTKEQVAADRATQRAFSSTL